MTDLPAEAIEAAVKANDAFFDADGDIKHPHTWVHELARVMLEAAAPHIRAAEPLKLAIQVADGGKISDAEWDTLNERLRAAMGAIVAEAVAAERERCAQLADGLNAEYALYEGIGLHRHVKAWRPFAALLREQP